MGTKVREKPILFSGEMVRAILEGRKTQTRRVIKPPPTYWADYDIEVTYSELEGPDWYWPMIVDKNGEETEGKEQVFGAWSDDGDWGQKCPYGAPGERLWVRETHARHRDNFQLAKVHYMADGPLPSMDERHDVGLLKVYPSIHMPRWASRITLEVTDVRVERVQEIGADGRKAADVLAEGIPQSAITQWQEWLHPDDAPAHAFGLLWNEINEKRGFSWESNPWVWVIDFKRLEPTQ